jgi:hypothetical protein
VVEVEVEAVQETPNQSRSLVEQMSGTIVPVQKRQQGTTTVHQEERRAAEAEVPEEEDAPDALAKKGPR